MAPPPTTPRRTVRGRPRGRPKGSGSASASRVRKAPPDGPATEPPPKRRRYIPGGPGGGGRFVDEDGTEIPTESLGASTTASRPRASAASHAQPSPAVYPRRERSTRIRTAVNRDERDDMQYSSAAAVAAAVVQSEGYKPREERGWEEFHPNLDIEATFMVFHADEIDGVVKSMPPTPAAQTSSTPLNGASTPTKEINPGLGNALNGTPGGQGKPSLGGPLADTPSRRRVGRPPRDSVSLYATRPSEFGLTPKVPKVLPIHNQTPKERLDLKQPSYRKTNRVAVFESKQFGQARYVEKSMMNVGYQESDNFIRPDRKLIKATDANVEEEHDQNAALKADSDSVQHTAGVVGRVEYDMDEQDDMWLGKLNEQRRAADLESITREIFEITITKIEKEWHALEKRIPKPNPKPPQTHRPRSSSAAAVNGEPHAGEEQDSKCAICDDGDCENTNAIVFCDGCDLAVHQECYGVPFIPEGQWLCRKCQLIGRGIPTCIFCPNTDGAFKQTNSSKWAHLLCAMWIPEVSLGNHTFMEPVMEVEKVPKTRWRLTCYICNQRMGACIQCSNKSCYQAFHVTCARRCRLFLKMKNSQGALAVLDGTLPLKAFCDKHCPQDYAKENGVGQATRDAKRFYKRTMKGRIWADSQASALQLAATHRNAMTEHPPDESQMTGAKVSAVLGDKKKGQPAKNIWKLPSGAPVIPQAVYDHVESALSRFPIRKRKDFVAEACRYWTLKREARRGAALLKRLQLQMETFSSMELTRRNFAAMGPSGKARLTRRVEFCRSLLKDLEQLKELSDALVRRETDKLEDAEMEQDFVDTCYFPVFKVLQPVLDKAFLLDKNIFKQGFTELQDKLDERFYTTTLHFAHDLCQAINVGINTERPLVDQEPRAEHLDASPMKQNNYSEARDRRRLGKRILKSLEPYLEAALRAEADICGKPLESIKKELEGMIEASLEVRQPATISITVSQDDNVAPKSDQDVDMVDAPVEGQIIVADQSEEGADADADADGDVDGEADADHDEAMDGPDPSRGHGGGEDNIEVSALDEEHGDDGTPKPNGSLPSAHSPPAELQPEAEPCKENHHHPLSNGFTKDPNSNSPPSLPGSYPQSHNHNHNPLPHHHHHVHSAASPLTPPQSHGSFAGQPHHQQQPSSSSSSSSPSSTSAAAASCNDSSNMLSAGGIPWYLSGFDLQGTSAVEEQWTGREAVRRALSEELTDMDDDALKDLEFDVDEENTITASPPVAAAVVVRDDEASVATAGNTKEVVAASATPKKSLRSGSGKGAGTGAVVAGAGTGATAAARKGVRSSARRR
ncbi:Peregrin [Madurella mycetomatis]|uniref:Peregrin n=1 Tax=Madurella mycetomatis TaxID=100816 RepID=A0A175VY59_9PEZI|nr:Peregrin [Madurella mycetomatis]